MLQHSLHLAWLESLVLLLYRCKISTLYNAYEFVPFTSSDVAFAPSFRTVRLQVDVCDKVEVSVSDPTLDASYYSSFTYKLLDGSGEEITFDSTPAKDPTGEVQVRSAYSHA